MHNGLDFASALVVSIYESASIVSCCSPWLGLGSGAVPSNYALALIVFDSFFGFLLELSRFPRLVSSPSA